MYVIKKPAEDMSGLIEYFWELSIDSYREPFGEFIFSYPFNNLVLNLEQFYISSDSISGNLRVACDKFIGSRLSPVSYVHASGNKVFGIKFSLGGAYPFTGISALTTNNMLMDLQEVLGYTVMCAMTAVKDLPDFETRVSRMDDILRSSIHSDRLERRSAVIKWLQPILDTNDYSCSIHDLADKAHISIKTLERKSFEVFGASPKQIISSLRCRAATREIERTGVLSDCLQFGYWDQSHYIKELKRFTGKTPTSLLELRKVMNGPSIL